MLELLRCGFYWVNGHQLQVLVYCKKSWLAACVVALARVSLDGLATLAKTPHIGPSQQCGTAAPAESSQLHHP